MERWRTFRSRIIFSRLFHSCQSGGEIRRRAINFCGQRERELGRPEREREPA